MGYLLLCISITVKNKISHHTGRESVYSSITFLVLAKRGQAPGRYFQGKSREEVGSEVAVRGGKLCLLHIFV